MKQQFQVVRIINTYIMKLYMKVVLVLVLVLALVVVLALLYYILPLFSHSHSPLPPSFPVSSPSPSPSSFPVSSSSSSSSSSSFHHHQRFPLAPGVVGPESLAFDCNGEGPYTGVSDGRILKWEGPALGWRDFAFTSPQRQRRLCDRSNDLNMEPICGRPLGLDFMKNDMTSSCDLYIADSYFGLLRVGPNGGLATRLARTAEGIPFRFTNALDIDHETGMVYFTDTSTRYQRREYMRSMNSGDATGRLMRYNPVTGRVRVLLRGLSFANGVALNKNKTFILLTETTSARILRYWLKGPNAGTSEVFFQLPGRPDNIKRNVNGEFWVALNPGTRPNSLGYSEALRLNEQGRVIGVVRGDSDNEGSSRLEAVSEVHEKDGELWIGSVVHSYVDVYRVN